VPHDRNYSVRAAIYNLDFDAENCTDSVAPVATGAIYIEQFLEIVQSR
jgi:hypothetical protein